jgi:hypothetical protein
MVANLDLARFQADLLEILAAETDSPAILAALAQLPIKGIALQQAQLGDRDSAIDEELRNYLASADPAMLEVAAALVKKWGFVTSGPQP